jgi:hypothetical protein
MIKVKFTNLGVSWNGPKTGYTLSIHGHVVGKMRVTNMFDMFWTTGFLGVFPDPFGPICQRTRSPNSLGTLSLGIWQRETDVQRLRWKSWGTGPDWPLPDCCWSPQLSRLKNFQQPKYINICNICQTSIYFDQASGKYHKRNNYSANLPSITLMVPTFENMFQAI